MKKITRKPAARRRTKAPASVRKTTRAAASKRDATREPGVREMHDTVVDTLHSWVDGLDEEAKHRPFVAAADGSEAITPAALYQHVKTRTPIGKQYVSNLQRLAVRQVLQKFTVK